MLKRLHILLLLVSALSSAGTLYGQEVLDAAKVSAQAKLKNPPSVGLPIRTKAGTDRVVWAVYDKWYGAASHSAQPYWEMEKIGENAAVGESAISPVLELCKSWAAEKPKGPVDMVWGPYKDGWFAAICKKTRSSLGWKSIGFVIPKDGKEPEASIYKYSYSVNWLENRIGYNLFPKLPAHLQEIIEEISSSELLSPVQEFDSAPINSPPDREEMERDWEEDARDAMM